MRQIFTISCLGLFFISSAQTIKAKEKNAIVFRCRAIPSSSSNEPLFVIDGIPKEKFNPKEIDPDNIESINISNEANSALIFCNTNPRCVILITTKTANQRVIKVKDILTGEIIPGATIELAYKENNRDTSLYRQTDSVGSFITNKINDGKEYELKVSSVGYKPFKTIIISKMIGKGYSVLLEKNYSQLSEVVITTDGSKTIRCWACCITRVVKDLLVEKRLQNMNTSGYIQIPQKVEVI